MKSLASELGLRDSSLSTSHLYNWAVTHLGTLSKDHTRNLKYPQKPYPVSGGRYLSSPHMGVPPGNIPEYPLTPI